MGNCWKTAPIASPNEYKSLVTQSGDNTRKKQQDKENRRRQKEAAKHADAYNKEQYEKSKIDQKSSTYAAQISGMIVSATQNLGNIDKFKFSVYREYGVKMEYGSTETQLHYRGMYDASTNTKVRSEIESILYPYNLRVQFNESWRYVGTDIIVVRTNDAGYQRDFF